MIIEALTLIAASLFTGGAFYMNFSEQPARLHLTDEALLNQWKQSSKRGFLMQSTLCTLTGILGIITFFATYNWIWMAGSILMLANWPYTMIVISPINSQLFATNLNKADAKTRALIKKWGGLHAVRTTLGAASTLTFLLALLG